MRIRNSFFTEDRGRVDGTKQMEHFAVDVDIFPLETPSGPTSTSKSSYRLLCTCACPVNKKTCLVHIS